MNGTNDTPIVSVITIFLNAENFLQEAVESVFAQDFHDWELLLVDDGSTDASTAIARRYSDRYSGKVRYLEHEGHRNRGMSASRNLGIKHARGEYVALLDSDDVWLPEKLRQQVAILEAHPEAGMVFGAPQYWHSWTGNSEDAGRDHVPCLPVPPGTLMSPPSLFILSYPLGTGGTPCPSDLLFRAAVTRRNGGFVESFTGKYQMYEDQAFLAKVYLEEAVFVAGEFWIKYRIHPESCVSTVMKSGQYDSVRLYYFKWLMEYLAQRGVENVEVWRAARKASWRYRHPILHRLYRLSMNRLSRSKSVS